MVCLNVKEIISIPCSNDTSKTNSENCEWAYYHSLNSWQPALSILLDPYKGETSF